MIWKKYNFFLVWRTDPGQGQILQNQKILIVYKFCCMLDTHLYVECPDREFKYLSFDTKLNAVAPIGAELWPLDRFGSSRFGQSSLTHISKTGQPKKLKILQKKFSHKTLQLCQFSRKSESVMSDFIRNCVDLIWNCPKVNNSKRIQLKLISNSLYKSNALYTILSR